jgi:predicted RNase H-like HicB family nuclease
MRLRDCEIGMKVRIKKATGSLRKECIGDVGKIEAFRDSVFPIWFATRNYRTPVRTSEIEPVTLMTTAQSIFDIKLYSMRIWWSSPDKCYVGNVPELPGCMADGKTRTACVRALEETARSWIEVQRKRKKGVPAPQTNLM